MMSRRYWVETRPISHVCSVCHTKHRYLYYTDWGTTASVVRTRLDGSSPKVLKSRLDNPNGIAVTSNRIYVTDSHYKTRVPANARSAQDGSLYSMNLDGTGWTDVLSGVSTPNELKVHSGFFCLRIDATIWKFWT